MTRFESQHTEWKESWRDDLLRWVCGFANAEGGRFPSANVADDELGSRTIPSAP